MKVAVLGLGYVGTVTAAGLAASGHDVTGVDIDPFKVGCIAAGRSPVVEPGIDDLVQEAVSAGRLRATSRIADALSGADVSLICVGTPSASNGGTDLRFIERVAADLREAMDSVTPPESGHHSIVIRSTVPPGTVEHVAATFFQDVPDGWSVGTAMCPEFLREGCGLDDFFDPGLCRGRHGEPGRRQRPARDVRLPRPRHLPRRVGTAEALKYACNAFHATKISFANEMARIFRNHGIDSRRVMSIFCDDRTLNISPTYLRPGFAFGGSCLPKDLRALQHMARVSGVDAPLLAGTTLTNELVVRDRWTASSPRSTGKCACSGSASRWTPTTCARVRTSSWQSG